LAEGTLSVLNDALAVRNPRNIESPSDEGSPLKGTAPSTDPHLVRPLLMVVTGSG
jgi:hypothetical protein